MESDGADDARRWFLCALAFVVSTVFAYLFAEAMRAGVEFRPEYALRDFTQVWRGANVLERGEDPWRPLDVTGLPYPYGDRLAYPLPAILLASVFNHAPLPWIAFGFAGLSVLVSGLALAGRNTWHVLALASWQNFGVVKLLQWSGFMTAAARWDWALPLVLCKPNLGLAVLAYHPSARRFAIVAALGASTLLIDPDWIFRWREAANTSYYVPPALVWKGGGPLLLLAASRWRLPEGRLLLALSLIPHNLLFYDQFLLFLICRKGRETLVLVLLGFLGAAITAYLYPTLSDVETAAMQVNYRAPVVVAMFLPCLFMVLRRKQPEHFRMKPDDEVGLKF